MPRMADDQSRGERPERREGLAAVIAALVGLLALVVSGYTAVLQRKQVAAQVWPHLEMMRYPDHHAFTVSSTGVGPARVKRVRVTVDGHPVPAWNDMLAALGLPLHRVQAQLSGRVIPPGQN